MEVLYDDTDEHVQDKETNQKQEGYEVDKTPFIVVHDWLKKLKF
jgi:hypothetical protein